MRASEPVSGSVAPIRISEPDGTVAAVEPPDGCCAWSVDGCLHAPSASAQRTKARFGVRMARYPNHFSLRSSSRVSAIVGGYRSLGSGIGVWGAVSESGDGGHHSDGVP